MDITSNQYNLFLNLYNSKRKSFTKKEFCQTLNIKNTNTISYNKVIKTLILNNISTVKDYFNKQKLITIDRRKLERFIRSTKQFKNTDNFIHSSTLFAETGK